jgi:hypothetical protein
MARQKGIIRISGTLDGITFYRSNGSDLARTRSSLNKERFYTDPAFERSRKIAGQKKITAPLASRVYRTLPVKMKKQGMIGKMIAEAGRLYNAGLTQIEILGTLNIKFNQGT